MRFITPLTTLLAAALSTLRFNEVQDREAYITRAKPQSIADIERLDREYDLKQQQNFFDIRTGGIR